jgi:tRNA(Ile)-lysidine synthase
MPLRQPERVLLFDADRLRFPFVLRPWRNGDWLVPFGMKGKKKVSDMFTDLKYDSFMKASAVMVVDVNSEMLAESQHIAGVAGVRIDDRYKVTPTTSSVIRVTVLP